MHPSANEHLYAHIPANEDGGPIDVDLITLNGLFHDIHEYNEQFSMGAMMGRFVVGFFDGDGDESSAAKIMREESTNETVDAETLSTKYAEVLTQIGLGLEPVEGKTAVMMVAGERAGTGEMRVNIMNGRRFASFLSSLTPEQVFQVGTDQYLLTLCRILSQQLFDNYDLANPSDEAIEFLGRLGKIIEEYKRLRIEGWELQALERYFEHSRKRDLREFVAVERQGLMQEPHKGFGPADWQTDASVSFLENKWANALVTLEAIHQNPNAAELYGSLRMHLGNCAILALEFLEKNPDYYPVGEMADVVNILEQARQRIETMG